MGTSPGRCNSQSPTLGEGVSQGQEEVGVGGRRLARSTGGLASSASGRMVGPGFGWSTGTGIGEVGGRRGKREREGKRQDERRVIVVSKDEGALGPTSKVFLRGPGPWHGRVGYITTVSEYILESFGR